MWRDLDTTRPPDTYKMSCLVFSDKPSPCEANFAVLCTTEDNEEQWPQAAAAVNCDMFVDDLYTACTSVTAAIRLCQEVTALLAKGGFPMCKWLSSSRKALLLVPEVERAVPTDCLKLGGASFWTCLGHQVGCSSRHTQICLGTSRSTSSPKHEAWHS